MKIFIFIMLFALLSVKISFAEYMTGYSWSALDDASKTLIMVGYIKGYYSGATNGIEESNNHIITIFNAIAESENDKNKELGVYLDKCSKFLEVNTQSNKNAIKASMLIPLGEKTYGNYVYDIESFYKQYPLCKSKDFFKILTKITTVWANKATYREIGESCLNDKN